MYSIKRYKLTKEEYNYLLPVLKNKLSNSNDNYYFLGNGDELDDMLSRLKGLYNYFDDYNKIINYRCFSNNNLQPFRLLMIQAIKDPYSYPGSLALD